MLGEGLTLERVEREIAAFDEDPNRGNQKHEITRGDWMLVRLSILEDQMRLDGLVFDSSDLSTDDSSIQTEITE